MKRRTIIILAVIALVVGGAILGGLALRKRSDDAKSQIYQIPRVLVITTGKDGTGTLPEGVLLVKEAFTARGAFTRLSTRDALLDKEYLASFDILIMLTAIEYHDADRQYSLTFMDDLELEIIREWVENGGVLIAGDNLGRNLRNGTDRISIYGRLEPDQWPLSHCFGVMMSERNMEGFALRGNITDSLNGELVPALAEGSWILVPDSVFSDKVTVLASWENDSMSFPAMLMNTYGQGIALLLPTSYLLHPSNNGGHWSALQIDVFCGWVLDRYQEKFPIPLGLHPWPDGKRAAFAVSLNSDGNLDDYQRLFRMLDRQKVVPTLFVNGSLDEEILALLTKIPHRLQSNGLNKINMRDLSFSETVFQVEMNEQYWNQDFTGFRFPYTLNSVWGMEYLQRKGYTYESSIGADHTQYFKGSLFPYHLPVFQGENYQILELLEISPVAKDDYFYFRMIQESEMINPAELEHKARLFDEYLRQFWQQNALRRGGMMVYLGHPLFTGYSDTTLMPLRNLIDTVKRDQGWITSMEEMADRWHRLDDLRLQVTEKDGKVRVQVRLPEGEPLKGLTLTTAVKPQGVSVLRGKVNVENGGKGWMIIFDADDGQTVSFSY